ncbi:MAG: FKBP-type peptidyl-prolyl cis-trans isomerase [Desulfobacter sp.]|nr:FKBP-type peptidyl-prolyl cis-trans isomerase [Desulfobacter sp.]WDP87981.1 MAG: FKBP-type peptidyl-prolyl cis-trans isomerase [Desulfobacter sp.]
MACILIISQVAAGPVDKKVEVLEKSKLTRQISYALGYDVFTHVSGQIDLDMDAFIKGVQDAHKKTPALTEAEMKQMLMTYQGLARKAAAEASEKIRQKHLAAGAVFMEGNKLKQGVITLSSGLQYKVITQGTGPVPALTDSVECHYRGTFLDGTQFDSSYSRGRPASFQVTKVIPGWTRALTRMPVGSKWELYVPADLAYGDKGAGQTIQPGQTLVFQIELLGILD